MMTSGGDVARAAGPRGLSGPTRIFIGLVLGILVGWLWPSFAVEVRPLADIFLRKIGRAHV